MTFARIVFPVCLLSITTLTQAQIPDAQALADNYATCLKAAVIAERTRETPSVEQIKQTCAEVIAAFHEALPDHARAMVINLLDQRLLEELQQ